MNNKTKNILILVISIIIIGLVLYFVINKPSDNNENSSIKKDCIEKVGGGYNIYFDTNEGEELEYISVCIACSPESYKDLPIPTKKDSKFLGWYLDSDLTNKLTATNTRDINPIEIVDENGCKSGYKNLTLYAKWVKIIN